MLPCYTWSTASNLPVWPNWLIHYLMHLLVFNWFVVWAIALEKVRTGEDKSWEQAERGEFKTVSTQICTLSSCSCTIMAARQTVMLLVAVVLSIPDLAHSFQPLLASRNSITHRHITQRAILQKTAEVCRDLAALVVDLFAFLAICPLLKVDLFVEVLEQRPQRHKSRVFMF